MLSKALLSNKSYPEISMIFKSAKVLFSFHKNSTFKFLAYAFFLLALDKIVLVV